MTLTTSVEQLESLGDSFDFSSLLKDRFSDSTLGDIPPIPSPYEVNNLEPSHYCDTDSLSKYLSDNPVDLYLHLNIQSLSAKFDALRMFLNSLSRQNSSCLPEILALSETWLCKENEHAFNIEGYQQFVSNCRSDKENHGGIGFFIREGTDFVRRNDLSIFIPFIFESVFITLKSKNITLGVIYRTPSADSTQFLDEYNRLIEKLESMSEHFILFGDFNFNYILFEITVKCCNLIGLNECD